MMGALRSVAILLLTFLCTAMAFFCGAILRSERLAARSMRWWGAWFIRLGGWSVRAEGVERLPETGAILAANHQSYVDIPLVLSAVRPEVKFLAKRELGRIPLFGKAMAYAGNLFIDREDPRDAIPLMREAVRRLSEGHIVVIFPEGTRSADGAVGEFKPGAFYIAQKAGVPVWPVYIDGGRVALPKGALLCRPAGLVLRVLEPLRPAAGESLSRQGIAEEARRRIALAREEEQARFRGVGM